MIIARHLTLSHIANWFLSLRGVVFMMIYFSGYLSFLPIDFKQWWLMDACLIGLVCGVEHHKGQL